MSESEKSFLSERKKELIQRVVNERTRHITLVFQDTYQPLNASAAMRTAEIFGLQDVYTIEQRNPFRSSVGISRGAVSWIDIHRFQDPHACFDRLKELDYVIVATTLTADAIPINQVPIDKKIALVFGNELRGVTQELLDRAEIKTYIPMYGFTQSFNLSVSVGICLQELMPKIRSSELINWPLSCEEKESLIERFIKL
jgi:tRNA (guanosine-2'-O-)-methyltransferase